MWLQVHKTKLTEEGAELRGILTTARWCYTFCDAKFKLDAYRLAAR